MQDRLKERKGAGSLRQLKDTNGVDFMSNDYLGYARVKLPGSDLPAGSTGSRLLSGNHPVFSQTEEFLASFFGSQAALLFNSGYNANLGLISALSVKNSLFIFDSKSHASVRDGLRMGFGQAWHFEHNDLDHLESLLQKAKPNTYVLTESVFSMDGDQAPLKSLAELCARYKARLIVDEAHSGGIFGREGRGSCEEQGVMNAVFARVITFGKAYGRHGAVVLGSNELREYLINFSRPFIYSTAMPPSEAEQIRLVVQYRANDTSAFSQLIKNMSTCSALFGKKMETPILVIPVKGGNSYVREIELKLKREGFSIPAILSPTVPEGEERLRLCLHSFNTSSQIEGLFKSLPASFSSGH